MEVDEKEKFEFKSEVLKTARESKGYKQEDLAKMIFTTRQSISNWENGKKTPTLENVNRLSKTLGISMDDLIVRKVEENLSTNEEELANSNINNYSMVYFPNVNKGRKDLKFIKRILLLILIILVIYLICSIRKFCILTDIRNKMLEYENVSNYHLITNYYEVVDGKCTNSYKEDLYCINNCIKRETEYKIDDEYKKEIHYIKDNQKIILDVNNKTYEIVNGEFEYSDFITSKMTCPKIKSKLTSFMCCFNPYFEITTYINYDLNYTSNDNIKVNERINKSTGLIEEKIMKMNEKHYSKTNFEITIDTVTLEDIKDPDLDEYIQK